MAYSKKEAKLAMLEDLKKAMMEEDDLGLGEKLGMNKVVVAAEDEEGLEEGLTKAQKILQERKKYLAEKKDEDEE